MVAYAAVARPSERLRYERGGLPPVFSYVLIMYI